MTISPQGNIYLCKTPLANDYKNQLTFTNKSAQDTYFNSCVVKTFDNYTYIKKDNSIKVNENIDNIIHCNYLFYVNTGFTSKIYYCFITDMRYINENCTEIFFETDCWQTWYFDVILKNSFVEREHVNDDTIGKHTIDEGLNVGEIIEESSYDSQLAYTFYVIVESTYSPSLTGGTDFDGLSTVHGQFFGARLFAFSIQSQISSLVAFIRRLNKDGKISSIQNMYLVPAVFTDNKVDFHFVYDDTTYTCSVLQPSYEPKELTNEITKLTSFSDYTPKNNKVKCFPYNYLFVTNHNGNSNIYRYENFSTEKAVFKLYCALNCGCSCRLTPQDYKGITDNDDESIPLGKYPTISWTSDAYTNWLTQQAINIPTKIVSTLVNTAIGYAAGNVAGAVVGAAGSIAGLIGEFRDASLIPNVEQGSNTADVITVKHQNTFTYRKMRAKKEYLQIIDDYFSMFGYKINVVKIPNITGRRNWNYVKTVNCNISGTSNKINIPQTDLNIIKSMFNNGVTFWHNPTNMYDYSQNNAII